MRNSRELCEYEAYKLQLYFILIKVINQDLQIKAIIDTTIVETLAPTHKVVAAYIFCDNRSCITFRFQERHYTCVLLISSHRQ